MVSIIVTYEDGTSRMFEHVVKIRYSGTNKSVEIADDELISSSLPVGRSLWLFTNNGTISVNGTGLRFVEARKE